VVTVEDNVQRGGFGEGFSNEFKNAPYDILTIAIPDTFVEHGDIPSLRKECGIDAESIAMRIQTQLGSSN
jgi:1-deoxy-D-xylulose-5-phosphate synthase